MKKLGIGVVGAGSIGIRGALMHLVMDDVQDRIHLAAVCDNVPGRAQAAAERFGVPRGYDTLEELLADPNVDLVTIGTPIGVHYEQGLAAVRAGKHVHFNKTMTVTTEEATHLIEEAARVGVKMNSCPGQMVQPQNQYIRQFLRDGGLGSLAWASVGAGFGRYHEEEGVRQGDDLLSNVNPSWYWKNPGGGPMYDMTVYGLHTLTGILGPAKRVTALSGVSVPVREFQGEAYETEAHDNTFLLLDFGGSLTAFVYGAAFGSIEPEWSQPNFFGSKGTLLGTKLNGETLPYPGHDSGKARGQFGRFIQGGHLEIGESHVFEDIMQLVDFVQTGAQPFGTVEHARHVIEIIEKGYLAAESGQTQAISTSFDEVTA
jgi:predicted dehydrogenase